MNQNPCRGGAEFHFRAANVFIFRDRETAALKHRSDSGKRIDAVETQPSGTGDFELTVAFNIAASTSSIFLSSIINSSCCL